MPPGPSQLRDEFSRSAYVRPPDNADPSKAVYERRPGAVPTQPHPTKAPSARPLSQNEKSATLPAKLVAAFPGLSLEDASRPRMFAPAPRPLTAALRMHPPSEDVLFGFWPAPPSSTGSKNVYPAPAVSEGDPDDAQRPQVHIFIDHSNVMYSFLNWVRECPESKVANYVNHAAPQPGKETKVIKTVTLNGRKARIDYAVLFAILERGRKVGKRVLVGSSPLWQSLEPAIDWVRRGR